MSDASGTLTLLPRVGLAFAPVLVFLAALLWFDSFRLVRFRLVAAALAMGAACAGMGYALNNAILYLLRIPLVTFAVVAAPLVEEGLKAAWGAWLSATGRVGFLIDGLILGFAIGTGFALVENLYYLHHLGDAPLMVWIVRGLGTAVMHGGSAALFMVILQGFRRHEGPSGRRTWPAALAGAAVFHAAFNRFMDRPLLATGLLLVALPLILGLAYRLGERRLRRWLGDGFDQDARLVELLKSGTVSSTHLGLALQDLTRRFSGPAVEDMLGLLRLQAELNIMAKGRLLLIEQGFEPALHAELGAMLREVRGLEDRIGRAGLLALRPLGRWQGRRPWQRRYLEDLAERAERV
ncbi:MAG: PrsW family glutamic-type intramembrane protease [Candidatus Krumholzibacteriia bacterium]